MPTLKIDINEVNERKPTNSLLTALKYNGVHTSVSGVTRSIIFASCECGNTTNVITSDLIRGKKLSCGCVKRGRKVKYEDKRLYKIWYDMIRRCKDINNPYYGAKGVKVCKEWEDYKTFSIWANLNGYNKTKQIDKDIKGDGLLYSPSTCLFVSNYENVCNRSISKKYDYKGHKLTLSQIAKIENIEYSKLKARVYNTI